MLQLHSTLSTPFPTTTVLISFLKLRCRPSLHSEVPPNHFHQFLFLLIHLLSNITQHYQLFQLTRWLRFNAANATDSSLSSSSLQLVHSLRLLACLLADCLPSLIACRFSTSLSRRCSNLASAIHNIHAVSHAVFHLFEFQPLSLLVLHPSAERNFTVDATTSLCA
jgi:hypothetical protein